MMQHTFNSLAMKKESKAMLSLALPAIISQLAQMSMGAIDTIMAGNLNTNALAAISVGSNLFMPLLIFSMGIFLSLNPLVATANGAKRYNKLGEYLRHGLYIALVVSVPTIIILNQLEPLMRLIGVQDAIIPTVVGYLKGLSFGVIPLYLFLVLRSLNEGLFSTLAIMYISIAAIPFNIALNTIFMYGYMGIPAMGAIGLGYATTIVWTMLFAILLIYTLVNKKYSHLVLFKNFHKPDLEVLKEILAIGVPLSVTIGLEVLMFAAVGLFIASYSINLIAAHQIAMNIANLAYMLPLGLSVAISARVGHALGSKDIDMLKRTTVLGIGYSIGFSLASITILLSIPEFLVRVYTSEPEVVFMTQKLLYLAATFMIFDAIQIATSGALRGMKDTMVPMYLSVVSYWLVGFPVGYLLAEVFNYKAQGYWTGFIAGLAIAAILLILRLRVMLKRKISESSELNSIN